MSRQSMKRLGLLASLVLLFGVTVEAQEMGPDGMGMGPDGMPAPQFDPNNPPQPPVKPEKPVPPPRLEPDMSWLEHRKVLEGICDGVVEAQFADIRSSKKPIDNPMAQRFREYLSEKFIVSEWQRTRPLGIDWEYPVPATTEAITEIQSRLEEQLERESVEKFPLLTHEQYLAEARQKYRLAPIRAMVEIPLRGGSGGRGVAHKIRGQFLGVTRDQVRLAPRKFISRTDLDDEVAAHFFKDVHEKMVKEYADSAVMNCELNRKNYVRYQTSKQLPEKLRQANYVPNHLEYLDSVTTKMFKIEHWTSRQMLVMKQQRILWEKNLGPKSIGERTRNEFMRRQGYRFLSKEESLRLGQALRQDEENRHIGWVPVRDIQAMEAWLVKQAAYERALGEYADKMQQYQEALIRYEQEKKEFDRRLKEYNAAGGGGEQGDEDEE